MTLYRIAKWSDTYETHETRKLVRLNWIPVPNKHDGLGFRTVAAEKDSAALFGVWNLLVQIASKSVREQRGTLVRDGIPLTARSIATMTGFPEKAIARALTFFSQSSIGWLIAEQFQTDLPLSPDASGESPGRMEGKGKKGMEGMDGTSPASAGLFAEIWAAYPKKSGKKAAEQIITRLLAKNPDSFGTELLEKTRAYAAACACWPTTERKYIPDPERWFKHERFNDDPETWRSRVKGAITPEFNKF